ncbi:hypothetical protein IW261DRAFT_1415575 [Armillaria novae-zelandiae]|uniref:Uncharacterized protein n=1 Tax=Armillaria novae-zelandiae TaxID=153914 RepID=A0AA39PPF5_9AGAR|nr:hypothetical protein IW261DRAFT_1415575 [Armillaria novae-zelandiae]
MPLRPRKHLFSSGQEILHFPSSVALPNSRRIFFSSKFKNCCASFLTVRVGYGQNRITVNGFWSLESSDRSINVGVHDGKLSAGDIVRSEVQWSTVLEFWLGECTVGIEYFSENVKVMLTGAIRRARHPPSRQLPDWSADRKIILKLEWC